MATSPGQASSQDLLLPQVTLQGKRALARSKGIFRVPLEDLGPALFNRDGAPTSGRHCMNLAKRILKVEGFAQYRYVAGYCHEPDPKNLLAVSAHGNQMADRDALLPRLGAKPLKGVFAKALGLHLLRSTWRKQWKHRQDMG